MFYIFLIAILNLGLGFAAAWHLGRRYNSLDIASPVLDSTASGTDLDDENQDATDESSMDLGTDEDDDTLEEDEEDIESLLNESAADTSKPATEDSLDEDSLDEDDEDDGGGDAEEGTAEDSTEQSQDTSSDELDADLDKLFENIDI